MKKIAIITLVAWLAACSNAENQDSGTSRLVSVNGLSQDGYISGAIIWHDVNNDISLDSGEPSAKTDEEGYFSRSSAYNPDGTPRTPIDYCNPAATETQQNYCLQIQIPDNGEKELIIRTQSGTDILTGEPFRGSVAIRTSVVNGTILNVVATPLTSILMHMTDAQAATFAAAEDLSLVQLNSDFLEFTLANENAVRSQAQLMQSALQAHKTVEAISAVLNKRYPVVGTSDGPSDTSDFVYQALADSFSRINANKTGNLITLSDFIKESFNTASVFNGAENRLRDHLVVTGAQNLAAFPAAAFIVTGPVVTSLSKKLSDLNSSISDTMNIADFDGVGTLPLNRDRAFAKAKVVEVIKDTVVKHIDDSTDLENINFGDIDDQVEKARDLIGKVEEIKTAGGGLLVSGIVADIYANPGTADLDTVLSNQTRHPDSSLKGKLAGNLLKISERNGSEEGELLFFFKGDSVDANSGGVEFCARFDSDINSDVNGPDDTLGSFYSGTWNIARNEWVVELSTRIAGSKRDITITSLGLDSTGTTRRYRANYTNNPTEWTPDEDLTPFNVGGLPSGNVADSKNTTELNNYCKALLSGTVDEIDRDGDGTPDILDAFPDDATETTDSDSDGVGDNADVFPNDASETKDTDGDGFGDNADAFPNDASESTDTDGDGVGDIADNCPTVANPDQLDSDTNGTGDACETPVGAIWDNFNWDNANWQ
jgi:hypothetical protein